MYSQLLRCSAARGSSAGFYRVSPTIVEVCKSFLSTESYPLQRFWPNPPSHGFGYFTHWYLQATRVVGTKWHSLKYQWKSPPQKIGLVRLKTITCILFCFSFSKLLTFIWIFVICCWHVFKFVFQSFWQVTEKLRQVTFPDNSNRQG